VWGPARERRKVCSATCTRWATARAARRAFFLIYCLLEFAVVQCITRGCGDHSLLTTAAILQWLDPRSPSGWQCGPGLVDGAPTTPRRSLEPAWTAAYCGVF